MEVVSTDADEPKNANSDVRYKILSQDPRMPNNAFLDCLSAILMVLFCFSKHYTQLAQPHTQLAKHLRSFAK